MVYFRFSLIDRVIFLGVDVSDPTLARSYGAGRLWEYRATILEGEEGYPVPTLIPKEGVAA